MNWYLLFVVMFNTAEDQLVFRPVQEFKSRHACEAMADVYNEHAEVHHNVVTGAWCEPRGDA